MSKNDELIAALPKTWAPIDQYPGDLYGYVVQLWAPEFIDEDFNPTGVLHGALWDHKPYGDDTAEPADTWMVIGWDANSDEPMHYAGKPTHFSILRPPFTWEGGEDRVFTRVNARKESSPELSSLAGKTMHFATEELKLMDAAKKDARYVPRFFLEAVQRLCGSVISQDETPK